MFTKDYIGPSNSLKTTSYIILLCIVCFIVYFLYLCIIISEFNFSNIMAFVLVAIPLSLITKASYSGISTWIRFNEQEKVFYFGKSFGATKIPIVQIGGYSIEKFQITYRVGYKKTCGYFIATLKNGSTFKYPINEIKKTENFFTNAIGTNPKEVKNLGMLTRIQQLKYFWECMNI